MSVTPRGRRALFSLVALCTVVTATLAVRRSRARADGPPTMNPLYATGIVYRGDVPLTGDNLVSAVLYSSEAGDGTVCITRPATTSFQAGRFRVPLDATCTAAVRANPDLWIELRVGDQRFPRSRLGVVPYAIEAARAPQASGPLDARLRALETPATDPECPPGFTRSTSAPTGVVLCTRGRDEMVRVGAGAELFWIDRYEASLWQNADATGSVYGTASNNYPPTFPADGTYGTPLYAVSVSDFEPSRFLTWFQADAACRANGKRLPTTSEWLAAARQVSSGCVTAASRPVAGTSAGPSATNCVSAWGAQHMIGNVWEWTEEWQMQLGAADSSATRMPWPSGFSTDVTINVTSAPRGTSAGPITGLPAAARRGGAYDSTSTAGRLAYALDAAPTFAEPTTGVRCVIGP